MNCVEHLKTWRYFQFILKYPWYRNLREKLRLTAKDNSFTISVITHMGVNAVCISYEFPFSLPNSPKYSHDLSLRNTQKSRKFSSDLRKSNYLPKWIVASFCYRIISVVWFETNFISPIRKSTEYNFEL